jgi:glycerol-3-phosphate O-acyltransferase
MLAAKISSEYHRINRVFASHLVAFVAFEMFVKQHPKLDLFGVLRLPEEELEISYEEFRSTFKRIRKQIYLMKDDYKINHATHMKGKADMVIKRGLDNVGIFHLRRPLLLNKSGNIVTQDLNLLYYYHNRLVGYELEKII